MSLMGKSALITGASRGLGAALAEQLAARGVTVVAVARHGEPLDELVARIRARGQSAHALTADVGDKTAILPLAQAAQALAGPIDILVHNASTLGVTPLRPLLDTECEDLERVLAVNLVGPFRLTKALVGQMALRQRGVVLHISSDAAVEAYPEWGAYSVSKAALDHLSRLWASELNEHGVTVFSVDPGEMDTAMHAAALPDAEPAELARPADVARRIVSWLSAVDDIPSGARLVHRPEAA